MRRRTFTPLILALGLLIAPPSGHALYSELPEMGDSAGTLLSRDEEQRIGAEFMRNVRYRLTLLEDPEITGYLQDLGGRLVSHSDGADRPFTFFIVQDPRINAFAAPGGYIGINSGLILHTRNESELAAVLAHEIAHVTQRHLARASETAGRMNLSMAAAVLAAMILGSQDPDLAQAAITAAMAGSTQRMINFTRLNEEEADRVGMQILADAGFDPGGMPAFFKQLLTVNRVNRDVIPEFLRTHPVTLSRIADSRNRAARYPSRPHRDSARYPLVRAKIRVMLSESADDALLYFKNRTDDAGRYGYALALDRKGRYREAERLLRTLSQRQPDNITYQYALAKVKTDAGKLDDALAIYKRNLHLYPLDTPLTMQYAFTLIQADRAKEAREVLHRYLGVKPPTPALYRLLAQAEQKAGFPVASRQAMAEYYFLEGFTLEAIRQLKQALESSAITPYERASIEARKKQFEEHARMETASQDRPKQREQRR